MITGTAQEGQTLTASANAGQSDNPVGYEWMENSGSGGTYQNIDDGTDATYQVKEGDEGFKIEVVATATNDNGATVSQTSAATAAVVDAAPTVTTPTITGTAQEGQTLTASANSGQSDNPVGYAWYSARTTTITTRNRHRCELPRPGRRRGLQARGDRDGDERQRRQGIGDQRGDRNRARRGADDHHADRSLARRRKARR